MSRCCWTARYEAAGHECQTDAMLAYLNRYEHSAEGYAALDALAAEAGYDVSEEQSEREGGAWWLWEVWGDTCILDAGHAGPHEFTRTKDILLDFSPVVGAGR